MLCLLIDELLYKNGKILLCNIGNIFLVKVINYILVVGFVIIVKFFIVEFYIVIWFLILFFLRCIILIFIKVRLFLVF